LFSLSSFSSFSYSSLACSGLPSRPTPPDCIRAALKLANVKADELLYDLDSGDGRVLVIAPWRCYRISGG
jgi:hypothetical protein